MSVYVREGKYVIKQRCVLVNERERERERMNK